MKWSAKSTTISIPLAVFFGIALLVCIYGHYSQTSVDWSKTKDIFDVVKNSAEIIAIGVGGVWAYFNFFKGRTYHSRLEPKVFGNLIYREGAKYLVATAQLKNVGLSDVKIKQEGSALSLFLYKQETNVSAVHCAEKKRIATFSVFEDHAWIEPGELIEDQRLIAIPDDKPVALRLELRLVSGKIDWNAVGIIENPILDKTETSKLLTKEGRKEMERQDKMYRPQEQGDLSKQQFEDQARTRQIEREKLEQREQSNPKVNQDKDK